MKFHIVYSLRSLRDLEGIQHYITAQSGNPETAHQFLDQLFSACGTLSTFPIRFAVYPFAKRWRMMPFGNYLVFFRIQQDNVQIGHIRHAARRPFIR
jgi:toxin ParE1/3/4